MHLIKLSEKHQEVLVDVNMHVCAYLNKLITFLRHPYLIPQCIGISYPQIRNMLGLLKL